MEKITKRFNVNYYFNWQYKSISDIKKDIEELEKLGATDVEIEANEDYGSIYISFIGFSDREETDEEFKIRLKEEQERLHILEQKELNDFYRLKLKYESK